MVNFFVPLSMGVQRGPENKIWTPAHFKVNRTDVIVERNLEIMLTLSERHRVSSVLHSGVPIERFFYSTSENVGTERHVTNKKRDSVCSV